MSITLAWRYGRLYSMARPVPSTCGSCCTSPESVVVLACVGKPRLRTPVTAKGRRKDKPFGRSPSPLPKKRPGEIVLKWSTPRLLLPEPPISALTPVDKRNSWGPFTSKRYLAPISRLAKPEIDEFPAPVVLMVRQVSLISMSKLGVMRFERSTEKSYSTVEGAPSAAGLGTREMVGSDISSATKGSSVTRVAGKKR